MGEWDSHLGDCTKYDPKEIDPDKEWDTIVIGSGIGGLATASLLAQSGQKVLVLEQHWAAGGCMHTFESNGYRFGTGIHYVGNMYEGGKFKKTLDALTPRGDPVVWDRMNEPYETAILGAPSARYERLTDEEAFQKYLLEKFPSEKNGIEEYFKSLKEANHAFNRSLVLKSIPLPIAQFLTWTGLYKFIDGGYSKWASISLQKALENMTEDKELQGFLASNYPDYGCDPSRSPFIMHAAMVSAYRHGAYFPHGGPSTIANKIIKNLVAHQSQVMVCANVKSVVVEQQGKAKVAKGVEMEDGTMMKAKTVVSDVGLVNTAKHLLPSGTIKVNVDDDHVSRVATEHLHPSQTFFSLFVGLSMDPETLNLPKGGVIFIHASNDLTSNVERLESMSIEDALRDESIGEAMEGEDLHLGSIFVNPACVHDTTWSQKYPEKSTIEILAACPYSWFAKYESDRDNADYEQMKTRLADKIWRRVVEVFEADCPNLPKGLEGIDHFQTGTPLTASRLLGGEHGAAFGLEHNMKRFEPSMHFLRLRAKLPEVSGLYLTGQDIAAAGFPGAMMGGLQCAATMLQVADPFTLIQTTTTSTTTKEGSPTKLKL